ncbi:RDD family protein [Gryllotalpicola reticulitermitis]|uniref:RDD family protein n=1 Tax=Gryllotalpicola reticulitermitis TaxID=1184153 RepID=A0ABV8Q9X3_9MICO
MSARTDVVAPSIFPGERLGLPESGHRSVGRFGRRIVALFIDWAIASAISWLITRHYGGWTVYPIFAALQILAIWALGGSIGHRIVGLRLSALPGSKPALWRPVVRSILLAVVVPALVWDSDQRGFHDKVAGTVLVRS